MSALASLFPVLRLEQTLARNPECCSVPMVAARAFNIELGPSGGPEALVYVHVEDLAHGCIYGHLRR